eukprot:SAG31_NODE_354_length_17223_cov_18.708771_6_plen_182_part_00
MLVFKKMARVLCILDLSDDILFMIEQFRRGQQLQILDTKQKHGDVVAQIKFVREDSEYDLDDSDDECEMLYLHLFSPLGQPWHQWPTWQLYNYCEHEFDDREGDFEDCEFIEKGTKLLCLLVNRLIVTGLPQGMSVNIIRYVQQLASWDFPNDKEHLQREIGRAITMLEQYGPNERVLTMQ